MKLIKASDLQISQWTNQTFRVKNFDDLLKQVDEFMRSNPRASEEAKEMFTEELKVAWNRMAHEV